MGSSVSDRSFPRTSQRRTVVAFRRFVVVDPLASTSKVVQLVDGVDGPDVWEFHAEHFWESPACAVQCCWIST